MPKLAPRASVDTKVMHTETFASLSECDLRRFFLGILVLTSALSLFAKDHSAITVKVMPSRPWIGANSVMANTYRGPSSRKSFASTIPSIIALITGA